MTDAELDAMEARAKMATEAPWDFWVCREGTSHLRPGAHYVGEPVDYDCEPEGATSADKDFINHARDDVPALVAEVRRLRAPMNEKRLQEIEEAIKEDLEVPYALGDRPQTFDQECLELVAEVRRLKAKLAEKG